MNLRLIMLRHGKTTLADKGVYYGHTDVLLSKEGIEELLLYKEQSIYPDADIYFTSGMTRANESLRLIKGDVDFMTLPLLEEYNFGDFELHTHDELCANEDYIKWIEDKDGVTPCAGGESRVEFIRRMKKGMQHICCTAAGSGANTAFLLAHGGVISYFTTLYYDDTLTYFEAMPKCGHGIDVIIDYDGENINVEKLENI